MTSQALTLWHALMAALLFIAGAANLAELMPGRAAAWFVLVVGALSAATGIYNAQVGTMPADRKTIDGEAYERRH